MAEKPFNAYEGDDPYFFVSYAHDEADLVYPEMRWIRESGFNLWYDDGIHVGSVWRQALADALSGAAGMIFFASATSAQSKNCQRELNFILDDDKPVFVVQVDDEPLPSLLRLALSDRQALVRSEFEESEYRKRLIAALQEVQPAKLPSISRKTDALGRGHGAGFLVLRAPLSAGEEELELAVEEFYEYLMLNIVEWGRVVADSGQGDEQARSLAAEHQVDYVLLTTVRLHKHQVRATLRLTTAAAEQVTAETWTIDRRDFRDESGRWIDQAWHRIAVKWMTHRAATFADIPDQELDPVGLILRAHLHGLSGRSEGIALARRAIAQDPDCDLAHTSIARSVLKRLENGWSRDVAADCEAALFHANEALRLKPGNTVSIAVHATIGDSELANDLVDRIRDANARMWFKGLRNYFVLLALTRLGRAQEVVDLFRDDDPQPNQIAYLACALTLVEDFEHALVWQRKLIANEPENHVSWIALANILGHLDRREEARSSWAKAQELSPGLHLSDWENRARVLFPRAEGFEIMVGGLRKMASR